MEEVAMVNFSDDITGPSSSVKREQKIKAPALQLAPYL
jgi:hypothetical protein